MKKLFYKAVRDALCLLDVGITRYSTLETLKKNLSAARDMEFLQQLNGVNAQRLIEYIGQSKSQLRQDLFVLSCLDFKEQGYFVEFGSTNGYDLSNTYLLESEFGWNGILAEPATIWHRDLKKNRCCHIETECVWKDSNSTLTFNQTRVAELSTINRYSNVDGHSEMRKEGETYTVKTISLNDLLSKYNAPRQIDYLSIDTEGSEYEILSHFDFTRHTFQIITCEHNYTPMRGKLYALLTRNGYQRVFEGLSLFDDWYIKLT